MELGWNALPGLAGRALWSFAVWISSALQVHDFISLMVLILAKDTRIQENQLGFLATPLENPTYWTASQLQLHLLSGFAETTARVNVKSSEK